jgi:hypothetical protein
LAWLTIGCVPNRGVPNRGMPHGRAPSREELLFAYGATIPDLIAPDLSVLLVGINPSLWSGLVRCLSHRISPPVDQGPSFPPIMLDQTPSGAE